MGCLFYGVSVSRAGYFIIPRVLRVYHCNSGISFRVVVSLLGCCHEVRRVLPYQCSLAGTPPWCVVSGLTVVCAWDTEPVSLFGRPPECLRLPMTRMVKLVLVSDFPQAQMTRLIHPDCLRSVEMGGSDGANDRNRSYARHPVG